MSLSVHNNLCHPQHSQLLVIDIQEKLANAMPEKVLASVLKNTRVLLQAATELDIPVIQSEQYPKGLGSTHAELANAFPGTTQQLEKTCFSCAQSEAFLDLLARNKRKQVIIAGIESHICVLQTAMQLLNKGYAVYIVEDAACSRKKSHHRNAMSRLQQHGITISNSESVLFEWLGDASHPAFKKLAKLIQ